MPERPDTEFWSSPRSPAPARWASQTSFSKLRDSWDRWRGEARFGLVILIGLAVIAGFVWYRIGSANTGAASDKPQASSTGFDSSNSLGTTTTTTGKKVVVHVAGVVARPGVVELAAGARVIDAIEAAGGGLADADLDRLNLAALLVDGQQVLVARVGDPTRPALSGVPSSGGTTTESPTGLINLNTATAMEIETLPGIGPVLAAAIIRERDQRGGFASVNELREVDGIGEKRFSDLRDLVTV